MDDSSKPRTTNGSPEDRARKLAEDALAEYAKGDKAAGDRLAEQAVKVDRATVEDVVHELEEDAQATHVPDKTA